MLEDSHGRRFYYLRLSVTDICNFRCQYCLPEGYQGRPADAFLSADELVRVSEAFAALGTRKIRLTGGEPSLRSDLPQLIERIQQISGIESAAVTTNGYQLPKHIQTWANAGLSQLNVSIDALDREQFHSLTGHDRFEEVVAGVSQAIELGIPTKVNAVLMKGVNDDLTQVLAWIKDRPVTFRYIEVMETHDQSVFFRQHHVSGGAMQQQLIDQGWQPVLRKPTDGPALEYWHPDYQGRIGLIMPYSKDFCASCNRLRVSSLGQLHLCLFADQGMDIRPWLQPEVPLHELTERVRDLVQGKAETHGLHEHNPGAMRNLSQIGG